MNKLREKLEDCAIADAVGCFDVETAEQITDDFSCQFSDWSFWISKRFENNQLTFKLDGSTYTTTELQQYFKENIYGK